MSGIVPVQRVDERLASSAWPELVSSSRFEFSAPTTLVLCGGFEERATVVLSDYLEAGADSLRVIVIEYEPVLVDNRTEEILDLCKQKGVESQLYHYRRDRREGAGDAIVSLIRDGEDVVIDISSMSRLMIVQLVCGFGWKRRFRKLHLAYVEAESYSPSKEEFEAQGEESDGAPRVFISSGVYNVAIVPELSAVAMLDQPMRAVVFPSFNASQLAGLRSEVQPSRFSVIHGVPPSAQHAWRREAIRSLNRIEELVHFDEVDASTLDYRETLDALLRIYSKYGEADRIVISPTGSKMQSVAVGIFRAFMGDVQIVYPAPRDFIKPKDVSRGVKARYMLALDAFGDV